MKSTWISPNIKSLILDTLILSVSVWPYFFCAKIDLSYTSNMILQQPPSWCSISTLLLICWSGLAQPSGKYSKIPQEFITHRNPGMVYIHLPTFGCFFMVNVGKYTIYIIYIYMPMDHRIFPPPPNYPRTEVPQEVEIIVANVVVGNITIAWRRLVGWSFHLFSPFLSAEWVLPTTRVFSDSIELYVHTIYLNFPS